MNFVISVELIPLVNEALDKNGCRIYDLLEYTCKYSGSQAYTERLVLSNHTTYCWNNVSCLKSRLLHDMITVILLKEILLSNAWCPNRDEVSERML